MGNMLFGLCQGTPLRFQALLYHNGLLDKCQGWRRCCSLRDLWIKCLGVRLLLGALGSFPRVFDFAFAVSLRLEAYLHHTTWGAAEVSRDLQPGLLLWPIMILVVCRYY